LNGVVEAHRIASTRRGLIHDAVVRT